MNQLDVYYRALLDYRRQTLADHNCSVLCNAIAAADTEQDTIIITRSSCTIETDWLEAIEKGLVYVEKAIKEERQFIRSNGEVIPIEKVKHVSRDSVEHLAKHSNLITSYEEGEDIIPEKLYTVERLNDYTVYENRFLYMLLRYLHDFVSVRYSEILDQTNTYEATVAFNKKVISHKQNIDYTVSMHDVKRDDPYLTKNNPSRDIIDRISSILKIVIAFLNTPLMQEVAKVPMLKPPITKTNVLKMNNNFKGAMALYEFIIAYDKKGYTIEKQVIELAPFGDDLAGELAEAGGLISFLAYEYGLGINAELKNSYLREEERRKVEEIEKRAERIETLKRRLKNSEIPIEEYTTTLEDQLRDLQGESERAEKLTEELELERHTSAQLEKKVDQLSSEIEALKSEIEDLNHKHFEEIQRLKSEHEDAMNELILKHEAAMAACVEKYETKISDINTKHAAEMQAQRDAATKAEKEHELAMAELRRSSAEKLEQIKNECDTALRESTDALNEKSQALTTALAEYDKLLEEKRFVEARVKALGGIVGDYTSRERFNELENEYKAFTREYKKQWEATKKAIKKQHLNINNLKAQKEKVKDEETDITNNDSNSD